MKEHIKEVIVVEGKNDTNVLQSYFDCDTIETSGDCTNPLVLERIKEAQRVRGVIVFTDPDRPGEHIRRWIQDNVPGIKHAFIAKDKAKTEKKVGVEHANKEDLWQALNQIVSFENNEESLSWQDYIDLGFVGNAIFRNRVCEMVHIGPCNAKTCFKRLNQMHITRDEIEKLLEDEKNG